MSKMEPFVAGIIRSLALQESRRPGGREAVSAFLKEVLKEIERSPDSGGRGTGGNVCHDLVELMDALRRAEAEGGLERLHSYSPKIRLERNTLGMPTGVVHCGKITAKVVSMHDTHTGKLRYGFDEVFYDEDGPTDKTRAEIFVPIDLYLR